MPKDLISVIIPTRNRRERLRITLDALIADPCGLKELVVIDGASNDGTVELLEHYGNRVRWISEPDRGEHDARNKGLRLARGNFIHFAGDDNINNPGSFDSALQYFQEHPSTDILFGYARQYLERPNGELVLICSAPNKNLLLTASVFVRSVWPVLMSDTVVMRSSVIERVGMFDLSVLSADYELWARSAAAGLLLRQAPIWFIDYILTPGSAVIRHKSRLALDRGRIARRYGTVSDQFYAYGYYIPEQLLADIVMRYAPEGFVLRVKQLVWKLKSLDVS